jgi:spore coat protein U-like protein
MRLAKSSLVGLTAAIALALAPTASGAPDVNIQVSATVVDACTLEGAPVLAFGDYDPTAADDAATATFQVICTVGTGYTINFDRGANETGGERAMAGGASETLTYQLYKDSAHTEPLDATVTITGTGSGRDASGTANDVTVYGVIPAGQYVSTGAYADTVVATVSF